MVYDVKKFNEECSGKRVYVNGEDVTDRCYKVDTSGMAWCFKQNEEGKFFAVNDRVAKETLVGKIEIR